MAAHPTSFTTRLGDSPVEVRLRFSHPRLAGAWRDAAEPAWIVGGGENPEGAVGADRDGPWMVDDANGGSDSIGGGIDTTDRVTGDVTNDVAELACTRDPDAVGRDRDKTPAEASTLSRCQCRWTAQRSGDAGSP